MVKRNERNYDDSTGQLTNKLYNFIRFSRRDRINLRNKVEALAQLFDWENLTKYYDQAYDLSLKAD